MTLYKLYFLMLLFFLNAAFAATLGKTETLFKIDQIKISGTKKVEPEAVREKLGLAVGQNLTNYALRDAIVNIYKLKYFENVEAHKLVVKGKNVLEFRLKEKPIVKKIRFQGNSELDNDELKEQIKTKEYSILDVSTIKLDTVALQKFYEEKGFFLANISYELKKTKEGSLDLVFNIQEYDKVRVKKVYFLGNKEIQDAELKSIMQTREESLTSGLSGSGNFKEFDFKADTERLKYYYKTKGYLQVNIGAPTVTVSEDKKWIFITLKINEGPKFSVNSVFFQGEMLFDQSKLEETTNLKAGDIYSEETLRKDIQALTELYQDEGYAFANVLRNLRIVPGENKVDIYYSFEKGEIAYFGKISVRGNERTRDKVVRRELRIHEGMRYSGSLLRRSKENVNRLGFFEPGSVIFNTVPAKGKSNVLDLEISIKERQTGQISIGAGYSTAQRGFFQASISQNNFRGLGQRLNLNVSVSDIQQTYNLGFTEPYYDDTLWTVGGDIYRTQNNLLQSFSSEKYGADIRVGYPIFEYTRAFATVRHEITDIENVRNPTVDVDIENGVASTLRLALRHDERNNIFEPTKGSFHGLSAEYAGFYGDQKWLKMEAEARYYYPVWGDLIFRSRARYQQLIKTTERPLPRTEKYQMGGPRNMRGYNFEDIGPKIVAKDRLDENGPDRVFNSGGISALLTQFEFEHPISKEAGLKWVLFYDAGNVFEEEFGRPNVGDDQTFTLAQNYGFGFRWFSPIGVLRFEFAYPIDPPEGVDEQQFHFDIGQLF